MQQNTEKESSGRVVILDARMRREVEGSRNGRLKATMVLKEERGKNVQETLKDIKVKLLVYVYEWLAISGTGVQLVASCFLSLHSRSSVYPTDVHANAQTTAARPDFPEVKK